MIETDRPHPMNTPGPFYVVDGCCTACGVPFAEAPGLFAYDGNNHCFVKQQPSTKVEFNQMLRAAGAAELQCIRYRGQDPEFLRRFGELGEPNLCDVLPAASIQPIFRNQVTFDLATSQVEALTSLDLALGFQEYLRSLNRNWLSYEFTPIVLKEKTIEFSFSWFQSNFHPIEFCARMLPDCQWLIRHSPHEKAGSRSVAKEIDDWLKSDVRFCKVKWYTQEQNTGSKDWQETPW